MLYKINKEIMTLSDTEVEKIHYPKYPLKISNADVGKTIIPNKVSLGKRVLYNYWIQES